MPGLPWDGAQLGEPFRGLRARRPGRVGGDRAREEEQQGPDAQSQGRGRHSHPARRGGYFSPASTRTLRMFCSGGSGQVVNSLNAQGGL